VNVAVQRLGERDRSALARVAARRRSAGGRPARTRTAVRYAGSPPSV